MADLACPACGTENRPGAKFCTECGKSLSVSCPACGTPSSGGRFCAECGTALTDARPLVPSQGQAVREGTPPEPIAERRTASLLFADLVGFTPISEARDPEAVRDLLAAYFERARAIVERYGGTVEKFIGDAVFAVWGVPATHEDDAERAVRAGLDLAGTATVLGEELGIEGLQMRVGITTGQVAVTLGAVGEGLVAGDSVNTAARIQSIASPGAVWVDDTTRSLTTASIAYARAGSHELKGRVAPVEIFRALRTMAVVGGGQRVDGLEAPFVGRDRELRLVKELFHATADEKRARLVLVAGEPGIGKSRLAWEFEKYADAITSQATHWLRGRCLSYGQGVAGRVVGEMVRSLLRVTETDGDDVVAAALDERLQRHVPDDQERAVLRPRLASLLGLSDATFEQADLFACWRAFFEALCVGEDSATLIVEDLQWADDGFLDFLDHLLDASRAPIMVLALARPDVTVRRAGIGAGRRSTTVYLEPLSEPAMGQLLDGLVADLPDPLRAELVHRAEGVPLYAVETVRALIDRDVVVASGGEYVLDAAAARSLDLSALGPPASLQALLAARLDALAPDERRVVQDASVLGLSFTRAGIAALTPADIDLDAALDSLRRKEILIVDADPRSPERGQFRFVQALLRGSAYDTLSRRDRKLRHLAVAEHLAAQPDADTMAGVLAAHYLDALAAAPDAPDAEQLKARAIALLEQAAVHAAGVGAPRDALTHYTQLLQFDLADDVLVRATIAAFGLAMYAASHVDTTAQWVDDGLVAAQRLGDEEATLRLTLARARLIQVRGLSDDAAALAQAVFDASIGRPDRVNMLADAARTIAIAAQADGDYEQAQVAAARALADVERYGDEKDFDLLLDAMGVWASIAGFRQFSALIRQAAATRVDDRDPRHITRLLNHVAAIVNDDPDEAGRSALRARQRSVELGLTRQRVVATGHVLMAYATGGHLVDAAEILRAEKEDERTDQVDWETYIGAASALVAHETGDARLLVDPPRAGESSADPIVAGWWLMHAAVTAELAGDLAAAVEFMLAAVERMTELGPTNEDVPPAFGLAVDLLVDVGELARIEKLTGTFEALPRGQRYRLLHGQVLRVRAHLSGTPAAGLPGAIDAFTSMGATYAASRTKVELAAELTRAGESRQATEVLAGVRAAAKLMGAGPLVGAIADLDARLTTPA